MDNLSEIEFQLIAQREYNKTLDEAHLKMCKSMVDRNLHPEEVDALEKMQHHIEVCGLNLKILELAKRVVILELKSLESE